MYRRNVINAWFDCSAVSHQEIRMFVETLVVYDECESKSDVQEPYTSWTQMRIAQTISLVHSISRSLRH